MNAAKALAGGPVRVTLIRVRVIAYLIGFQNRLLVMTQWAYSYFTPGRAARLITGRRTARGRAPV